MSRSIKPSLIQTWSTVWDHQITLNMQDKMECDLFKPSKHDVIHLRWFKNIQLQNSQQNLNLQTQQKVATTIIVFDTSKQNARNVQWNALKMERSLKHRHQQTELEI